MVAAPAKKSTCPTSSPDDVAAVIAARFCNGKVLVAGDESPTAQVYAYPNGTLQATTAQAPQRVQQRDGSWAPVDLTLKVNADGTVGPTMSAYPITMSGGTTGTGVHSLAAIGSGAQQTAIDWTGALPTPTLAGNTATYANIRPGVDLVVKATAAGMEQNIVLENRAAISQIAGLSLPVVSKAETSYTTSPSGDMTFKDAKGHAFLQIPQMLMWDAAADPQTHGPDMRPLAATLTRQTASTGHAAGVKMALRPDASWLNSPARQFPITLDPTLNPESTTFDTYVLQGNTTDHSGATDLQLGVTSGNITRSFLSWDMTGLEHAVISAAQVYFFDFFADSCAQTAATQWDMWYDTTAATASTTYTTQPAGVTNESNSDATLGFSTACNDGWVEIDGKNFFTAAAAAGGSRAYMQLRAHDESSTSIGFKQFRSRNADAPTQVPYAVITYTSTPVIGTRSTAPASTCATGSSTPYLSSKTPTLKSAVTDGDGATSTVNFQWWNSTGTTMIGSGSQTGVASGNTASTAIPTAQLTEGSTYEWRVDATASGITSAWSTWCAFTVDTTAPSIAPTVNSTAYPSGVWSGAAGTAGSFAFGAAGITDVNSYLYGLDSNPPTTVAADPTLGASISVSITPTTAGPHTLYVESVDRAGNVSPLTSYSFDVGSAALISPAVGSTTAQWTQLQGAAPSGTTGVTYQWRRADTDTWTNIPTGDVNLTVGGGAVTWPVAPTGGNYPSLNWNVRQTLANANTPTGLTGRWLLNDTTGTVAADASGLGNPGTCVSVTWAGGHGGSAVLNGTSSQITTAHTVVNTAGSFSVSAWVNLTSTAANEIAVSENSGEESGFDLRYQKSSNKWVFGRWNSDTASPTTFITASTPFTAINTWTHMVGTYNVSTGLMTVYANGVASTSTNTDTTPFAATGGLAIGHGEFAGAPTSYFTGSVADVQTYNTVLTAAQVTAIYGGAQVPGSAAALTGPLEARASFSGGAGGTSPETDFTFDPNSAVGAGVQVGPGSVNLVTGNIGVSANDVAVDSFDASLLTSRTFNSRRAGVLDPTHMFGPGWMSSATVDGDLAPYTGLTVDGSLVQVTASDGSTIGFTNSTTSGHFIPPVGVENLTLVYTAGTNPYYTLSDNDGEVVVFTQIVGAPSGQFTATTVEPPGNADDTTLTYRTATVDGVGVVQPLQMLAPVPAGVSCSTLQKGCRALTYAYASITTATGTTQTTWGDFAGRVKTISFTAWDPSSSAMKTVAVADYEYDSNGRLVAEWDPRLDNGATHLWTTYSYNADGTLAALTDNTQPSWSFTYTTLPNDLGAGRLASMSQSAISAGTATTTIVYNVPISGTSAPYNMSAATTTTWDEQAAPVQATAVFDPGQIPDGNQATGVLPTSWKRATVTYMDADSREVNSVSPGGYTGTTWYDQFGNDVQDLTPDNRAEALAAGGNTAATAAALSTVSTFDATGAEVLTTLGPQHAVAISTGAILQGRDLTEYTYDGGAPLGVCPCGIVTTTASGVQYYDSAGVQHDDGMTTSTETYNWTLFEPLTTTVDPAGLDLTTTTAYDSTTGQPTAVTKPAGGSTTNTAATTQTIYYTSAANPTYPECGSHPEWAGLTCRVQTGGQPATGPAIPATESTYDMYDNPTVVTELTTIGTLRTTTMTYDQAGRVLTTTITGAAGTGSPIPTTRNVYDPATGELTHVQSLDSSNNVTAETTSAYDSLGRVTSYTDTDGVQSTFAYDLLSRPTSSSDGDSSATAQYDTGGENRGLPTVIDDLQVGTITGSYDADGNLVSENWPNGLVVNHTYNEDGDEIAIKYTKPGCGLSDCTIYSQTNTINDAGGIAGDISTLSSQGNTYDADGRVTTVNDFESGQCTSRVYGFGSGTAGLDSDRTALTTYAPSSTGACQTSASSSQTNWTYDSADRVTTTSGSTTTYSYDSLGRVLSIPDSDTEVTDAGPLNLTYFVNDHVQSAQQGSASDTYTMDVDGQRVRSWIDQNSASHVNHYSDSSNQPSWTDDNGMDTRTVTGLDGTVAEVTTGASTTIAWQITDLNGNLVAAINNSDSAIDTTSSTDEYGNLQDHQQVGSSRYAWLGSAQVAADNPGGLVFMGARAYNPATGSFTSTDPIPGGSANSYGYCSGDSINCSDTSGAAAKCSSSIYYLEYETSYSKGHFGSYHYNETDTVKTHVHCVMSQHDSYFAIKDVDRINSALKMLIGAAIAAVLCDLFGGELADFLCAFVGAIVGWLAAELGDSMMDYYDADCGGSGGISWTVNAGEEYTHSWGRSWLTGHYNYHWHIGMISGFKWYCNG